MTPKDIIKLIEAAELQGYEAGFEDGHEEGYEEGYADGYALDAYDPSEYTPVAESYDPWDRMPSDSAPF